jgi:hypothetical protein
MHIKTIVDEKIERGMGEFISECLYVLSGQYAKKDPGPKRQRRGSKILKKGS